jgi:uncharacterized lipoprotein
MRHTIWMTSLVSLAAGCVTASPGIRDYEASFDAVWEATIEVFAEQHIPISSLEKDSGIISTEWASAIKEDMDCGSVSMFGKDLSRKGQYDVFVHEVDSGAVEVQVNTQWQASRYSMGRYVNDVSCSSSGRTEKMFHESLKARLSN